MSSKNEEACTNVVKYNNGYSVDDTEYLSIINDKQLISTEHPARLLVLDNCNTLIEVTVKAKGHKRTHATVIGVPNGEQNIEEKERSSSSGPGQNWCRTLREQTRPIMKQSLQHSSVKNQHVRKISEPSRDSKKRVDILKPSKHATSNVNKHLDEVPVKQTASQKKSKEHLKTTSQAMPSTVSSVSSIESILVVDRQVQCNSLIDCPNDEVSNFFPVRTLGCLIEELGHLIKDETSNKILLNMKQALDRIAMGPVKSITMDSEALALRMRLDASTAQLEEMSQKMNELCESLRKERDHLKREVHKYLKLLQEARNKQLELESNISMLKEQLNETSKAIQSKDKMITELQLKNKKHESSQKLIAELKADLINQTDVARQRLLQMQYLMLERDKLSVLSSHKDLQLNDYRNVVKEFQNQITEQLMSLKEACVMEENSNLQGSVIQGGLACSSPSPASSERSNVLTSWHDMSDVSLSTIEHNLSNKEFKKLSSKNDKAERDGVKRKMEDISELRNRDSTQLEFINLPDEESSHTLLFGPYKEQECIDQNETKDKDYPAASKFTKSNRVQQSVCTNSKIVSTKSSQCSAEEDDGRGSYKKSSSKTREPLQSDGKTNQDGNRTAEESSRFLEANLPSNVITPNIIREQFQRIFDDVRRKSRISVSVPSPPRDYPHPDWTDSSLPSISAASESHIVQSNGI